MIYHIIATLAGFLLDLIFGDPYWLPHPIRLIGNWISFLERKLIGKKEEKRHTTPEQEKRRGLLLVLAVLTMTVLFTAVILLAAYRIHPYIGTFIESIMTYQILATKCLKVESMKVYQKLKTGDIEASRKAVSMIVGRDTEQLDETGVAKAAIETVAENTSDGVIAPMIYTAIGGPILGFLYQAVNTMDSMVGYKNDRYLYFGRIPAYLDDIANYIPARLAGLLMVLASFLVRLDGTHAFAIFKRDRYNHASPNSAQTEAVMAGALNVQLAGDAWYFGELHKKKTIGDDIRPVEAEDIVRANKLLYGTAVVSLVIFTLVKYLILMF